MNDSETKPAKILILRLGSLGDILHTIPTQQELARQLPETEIHWLTESPYDDLLRRTPGISRVWTADTRKWRSDVFSFPEIYGLIRSLRRQNFDAVLDFQGLIKSAVLAKLSGAERVIGFAPERFKEPAAQHFYSETVAGDDGSRRHAIEINFELIRSVGCNGNGPSPLIALDLRTEEFRYVDDELSRLGISDPVIISPGAGWPTKRWPASNYGQLGARIRHELKRPVILAYGPAEEPLVAEAQAAAAPIDLPTFPTNILQLAALCRRAKLLVAGDTGPLHLAVALGTPTVAVLGPTSPWRNGPFNPEDLVVKRYLPCSNSYKRRCDEFICMDIPVEDVFQAVVKRLGKGAGRDF